MTGFKREGLVFCTAVILLAAALYFLGCATAQPQKEMTPEQKQAYRDSLNQAHTRRLQLLWSLGFEPFKQNDYVRAKKYFKQVAELDTTGIFGRVLYQRLGTCYLQLGQSDSAEWAYKLGIQNRPEEPYPYDALRYIYRNSGRIEDAIVMSQKLTELLPDSASNYRILGELLLQLDERDDAIAAYRAAVERDPGDKRTQEILDHLLLGNLDKLLENRKMIVEQFPDDMNKRVDLAETHLKLGQPTPAIAQLQIVLESGPEHIYALELLGEAYNQLEDYRQAANVFAKILRIQPEDKKNLCQHAISLRMLGQYTEAMRQAEKALRIDPNYGLAHIARGLTFETAADQCVKQNRDQRITFDDKLVYEQAFHAYQAALRDPVFSADARRYMEVVRSVIPDASDIFMNKDRNTPRPGCYDWALSFWKEISR